MIHTDRCISVTFAHDLQHPVGYGVVQSADEAGQIEVVRMVEVISTILDAIPIEENKHSSHSIDNGFSRTCVPVVVGPPVVYVQVSSSCYHHHFFPPTPRSIHQVSIYPFHYLLKEDRLCTLCPRHQTQWTLNGLSLEHCPLFMPINRPRTVAEANVDSWIKDRFALYQSVRSTYYTQVSLVFKSQTNQCRHCFKLFFYKALCSINGVNKHCHILKRKREIEFNRHQPLRYLIVIYIYQSLVLHSLLPHNRQAWEVMIQSPHYHGLYLIVCFCDWIIHLLLILQQVRVIPQPLDLVTSHECQVNHQCSILFDAQPPHLHQQYITLDNQMQAEQVLQRARFPAYRPHISEEEVKRLMVLALQEARKGQEKDEVPVGCVFARECEAGKWTVVVASHNTTNHDRNASSHCEINCLRILERDCEPSFISQCVLFVTVQPCIMCTHSLNLFHIPFVYFGQYNTKFGGCGSLLKDNLFQCQGGILEKESLFLLKEFYERGNPKLPEEQRHRPRKRIKRNEQEQECA